MSKPLIDLVGRRFDRLVVLKRTSPPNTVVRWLCRCDCGKEKIVRGDCLRGGSVRSCGCLQRESSRRNAELLRRVNITHGMRHTPEYDAWQHCISRCHRKKDPAYHRYGGRGITVCARWREAFENFFEDMGLRPTPYHSLDREDNEGHYCKDNCRWATRTDQANNRRSNRLIELNGDTHTLMEWSRITGLNRATIRDRIVKWGWSISDALLTPARPMRRKCG